ncbi:MAG: hydroxyisourate hydrolase [Rhodothermales bacterium]
MSIRLFLAALCALLTAPLASSQDLSTHVLDLARGVGGSGVPVMLEVKQGDAWTEIGRAVSAENGRVESFDRTPSAPGAPSAGWYRLTFDMEGYWSSFASEAPEDSAGPALPFFPEIVVVFRLDDPSVHTHVPVVVSPYGYSTYRGN